LPRGGGFQLGFSLDAYCTFVVDLDNQGHVSLYEGPPAPQPGDPDHYERFLGDIADAYVARFRELSESGTETGVPALGDLARRYPGLLSRASEVIGRQRWPGAQELATVLRRLDSQYRQRSGP
jgi:hypothetical protein